MTEGRFIIGTPARFHRRRTKGCTIVSASGDVDADATPRLKHELDLAIADGLDVIVDVRGARLIDDSARELLDGMNGLLHAFGGRLSIKTE